MNVLTAPCFRLAWKMMIIPSHSRCISIKSSSSPAIALIQFIYEYHNSQTQCDQLSPLAAGGTSASAEAKAEAGSAFFSSASSVA